MGIAVRDGAGVGERATTTLTRTVSRNLTPFTRENSVEDPLLEDSQMYIGENFVVKHGNPFNLRRKVRSRTHSGVVFTELKQLKPVSKMSLSTGAKRMFTCPNAGGSSEKSEILSFELLQRCFGADLQKTEMEVRYHPEGGSMTDYTCTMFSTSLGVSVTRAMKYHGDYTVEDAAKLLNKKLNGVLRASKNTMEKWSKQILHVWVTSLAVSVLIAEAYNQLPKNLKSNTVVLVTVTENNEVFTN